MFFFHFVDERSGYHMLSPVPEGNGLGPENSGADFSLEVF
jgi:hypothetical protein